MDDALSGPPRAIPLLSTLRVQKTNLFESIADQLEALILSGQLATGSRLPTEEELAAHCAVSRPVVREALSRLRDRGLVQTQVGAGTFVKVPDAAHLQAALFRHVRLASPDRAAVHGVYEARAAIELTTVRFAAERATGEDRARIRSQVEVMEEASDDREAFTAGDLGFHLAIAEASHSPLLATLLQPLVSVIGESISRSYDHAAAARQGRGGRPARERSAARSLFRDGMLGHHEILNAIESGDPERSTAAMQRHLDLSERYLAMALGLRGER